MSRLTALFFASLGIAAAAGCYTGPSTDSPAVHGPTTAIDGTDPQGNEEVSPEGGPAAATGIPCDVAKVLATSCTDCHGQKPSGGAPNSLVTYEDLKAPSKDDPAQTVAAASVARMKAAKRPMPPDGPLAASDIAILEAWVGAGLPRGSCGSPATTDGGADDGGRSTPKEAGADASVASVCTSGVTFPANGNTDQLMHPGKKCIGCHAATGAKTFAMAGTVYPTLHEPNDCNGVAKPNLSVLVIDALGVSHTIPVNAAGNFVRVTSLPMPYRAMVVDGNKVREMKTPQTDGDCNGCHSEQGAGSPGRVMAP